MCSAVFFDFVNHPVCFAATPPRRGIFVGLDNYDAVVGKCVLLSDYVEGCRYVVAVVGWVEEDEVELLAGEFFEGLLVIKV